MMNNKWHRNYQLNYQLSIGVIISNKFFNLISIQLIYFYFFCLFKILHHSSTSLLIITCTPNRMEHQGQLITICADDGLHLWNLRNKSPEIVHSLKFQKERFVGKIVSFLFNSRFLLPSFPFGVLLFIRFNPVLLPGP